MTRWWNRQNGVTRGVIGFLAFIGGIVGFFAGVVRLGPISLGAVVLLFVAMGIAGTRGLHHWG